MTYATRMLETHPRDLSADAGVLVRCMDACFACNQACSACADACLGEQGVTELVRCIRLNQDCADLCSAGGRVVNRQTEYDANVTRAAVEACAAACHACGDECERHASMHEHCRVCAEACRSCEEACRDLLAAMDSGD